MWFAFNSGYYDLWLQQGYFVTLTFSSCDLLSILDITIFDYNQLEAVLIKIGVVICFQFWILRSLITTDVVKSNNSLVLWFAFNSGYYDLWLQHEWVKADERLSCDLLSILDITIFDYNTILWTKVRLLVVICFQFWILRSLITTK